VVLFLGSGLHHQKKIATVSNTSRLKCSPVINQAIEESPQKKAEKVLWKQMAGDYWPTLWKEVK